MGFAITYCSVCGGQIRGGATDQVRIAYAAPVTVCPECAQRELAELESVFRKLLSRPRPVARRRVRRAFLK